ncbi:hypothetical protein Avbf_00641 [Armadillidium vulgare]|nr:hypothetical protein Avbf_00641 [Armadillidium vulgare]
MPRIRLCKGKIHYYAREKYYQAMQEVALDGCKKLSGDPVYKFYSGISLLFQGQIQGALRQLDPLKNDRDIMLGVLSGYDFSPQEMPNR